MRHCRPLETSLFQPEAGIHTSILISESLDGLRVTATRQNAGKSVCPMNVPAGTSWAVMVVFGIGNGMVGRLAQFEAAAADAQPSAVVASNAPPKVSREFIGPVIAFPPFYCG